MASKTLSPRDWARRKKGGSIGQVVKRNGNTYAVRFLGRKQAEKVGGKSLKTANPPSALLLEGSLDQHLTSSRSEARILHDWLQSHEWASQVAHKNIHTLEDLDIIGKQLARLDYFFVHFNCHGDAGRGKGPYIQFFPGKRTYLLEDQTISTFRKHFKGRNILFSACELGRYEDPMKLFKEKAGLGDIAAYSRDVCDYEATIVDICIYQSILAEACNFKTAVTRANDAARSVRIRGPKRWDLLRVF